MSNNDFLKELEDKTTQIAEKNVAKIKTKIEELRGFYSDIEDNINKGELPQKIKIIASELTNVSKKSAKETSEACKKIIKEHHALNQLHKKLKANISEKTSDFNLSNLSKSAQDKMPKIKEKLNVYLDKTNAFLHKEVNLEDSKKNLEKRVNDSVSYLKNKIKEIKKEAAVNVSTTMEKVENFVEEKHGEYNEKLDIKSDLQNEIKENAVKKKVKSAAKKTSVVKTKKTRAAKKVAAKKTKKVITKRPKNINNNKEQE